MIQITDSLARTIIHGDALIPLKLFGARFSSLTGGRTPFIFPSFRISSSSSRIQILAHMKRQLFLFTITTLFEGPMAVVKGMLHLYEMIVMASVYILYGQRRVWATKKAKQVD